MKALARVFLLVAFAASAAAVAVIGSASPASSTPVAVPAQETITPPEGWSTWDSSGDGMLTWDEYQAMSENDREALQDWIDTTLDAVDDNDFRAWASDRFDWQTRLSVDIPASGVGDQIRDIPGDISDAITDIPGNVADSAFDSVARRIGEGAAELTGYIGDEMARTGRPQLEAAWYQEHYQRMLGWAGLLLLPLAMLAIGGAVMRGDSAKVGHTLMQVPIAYLLGILAISAVSAATGLAAAMSRSLVPGMQESSHDLAARVTEMMESGMGPGLVLLLGLFIALAAIATLLWLLMAEAAIYAVVLFVPIAFAGRVWEPAREWGRKLLTLAFSLVAAKVVVFCIWALAVDGLAEASAADVPLRSALALAALLLMTALAPGAALRLVPMLEGVERAGTPGGAARSGLSTAYYAKGLTRGRAAASLGAGRGGGGGGGLAVTGQIGGASARAPAGLGSLTSGAPASRGSKSFEGPAKVSGDSSSRGGAPTPERPGPSRQSPASSASQPRSSTSSTSDAPRAAPPTPPPGTGSGRPWRRNEP